jgi:hypothetical protein
MMMRVMDRDGVILRMHQGLLGVVLVSPNNFPNVPNTII